MLRSRLFLLLILAAAFLFRVQTLHWNFFIHADTEFDTEATASLVHYGKLLVFPEKLTIVPTNEPLPPLEQGEILTQHGPLWPILGATVMRIFGWAPTMANAFLSLRILSLLSGLAIIALSYFITRKLIHEYAALACASFLTFSYVMADYSGNGSMYSLQTALYLLWIWSAMNQPLPCCISGNHHRPQLPPQLPIHHPHPRHNYFVITGTNFMAQKNPIPNPSPNPSPRRCFPLAHP
jgi:4-amino-4-deoxy-L-arabinose transferase-like glycosyltransferase